MVETTYFWLFDMAKRSHSRMTGRLFDRSILQYARLRMPISMLMTSLPALFPSMSEFGRFACNREIRMSFVPLELMPTAVARALSWLPLQALSQQKFGAIRSTTTHEVCLQCSRNGPDASRTRGDQVRRSPTLDLILSYITSDISVGSSVSGVANHPLNRYFRSTYQASQMVK